MGAHAGAGDAHAGRTETSVQLALDPRPGRPRPGAGRDRGPRRAAAALRAGRLRSVTDNGVLGDPAGATADEGRGLLAQALDDLSRAVTAWREEDPA